MNIRITPHRPGDGGILAMPMKKNIPVGREDWKLTTCPICGTECWESDLSREVQKMEPDLMVACTECALAGCKHEFVYDRQLSEAVCLKCGHVMTKEEKRAALEYANALRRQEESK